MTGSDITTAAQFGFAALAAVGLWTFIRDMAPRLLAVIEQNGQAMQRMSGALDKLSILIAAMDDRLLRLEERHARPGACPLGEQCPAIEQREVARHVR